MQNDLPVTGLVYYCLIDGESGRASLDSSLEEGDTVVRAAKVGALLHNKEEQLSSNESLSLRFLDNLIEEFSAAASFSC